ncbi:MAG: hypothetical protein MUE75_13740 [Algoriphagus sp.]|nr:hypothetical protein [Algoriphagus sp.]
MKKILSLFLILLPFWSFAQSVEMEAISNTVQLYFDGMIQRDRAVVL